MGTNEHLLRRLIFMFVFSNDRIGRRMHSKRVRKKKFKKNIETKTMLISISMRCDSTDRPFKPSVGSYTRHTYKYTYIVCKIKISFAMLSLLIADSIFHFISSKCVFETKTFSLLKFNNQQIIIIIICR